MSKSASSSAHTQPAARNCVMMAARTVAAMKFDVIGTFRERPRVLPSVTYPRRLESAARSGPFGGLTRPAWVRIGPTSSGHSMLACGTTVVVGNGGEYKRRGGVAG
jgi:hypothetical protein